MESTFNCDMCGQCCKSLHNNPLYSDLDRGDGVCRHYDIVTHRCQIYDTRPLKCNISAYYNKYLKSIMSKEAYYEANYRICKELKCKIIK